MHKACTCRTALLPAADQGPHVVYEGPRLLLPYDLAAEVCGLPAYEPCESSLCPYFPILYGGIEGGPVRSLQTRSRAELRGTVRQNLVFLWEQKRLIGSGAGHFSVYPAVPLSLPYPAAAYDDCPPARLPVSTYG